MATTPTLEDILSWPAPNYDNPRDVMDPAVYGVNVPLAVLMTLFIGGRFYSRTILVRNALGADDWSMLVAYIWAMTMTIVHLVELRSGIGRHLYDVRPEWLPSVGKFTLVTQVMFGPTAALTKISICLTYLRLFPSKFNRRFNYNMIVVLIGFAISTSVPMFVQCIPLHDLWAVMKPLSEKKCFNMKAFYIALAGINSTTDTLVYLYPAHYLWKMQMPKAKKIGLIICFSLGVIVCVAGMVRIWTLVRWFDSWDLTYNGAIVYITIAVEIDVGIICGCLPGIRPLLSRIFPKLLSLTEQSAPWSKDKGKNSSPNNTGGTAGSAAKNYSANARYSGPGSRDGQPGVPYRGGEIHVRNEFELRVISTGPGDVEDGRFESLNGEGNSSRPESGYGLGY